jgi:flagellar biosynthesis regulator FlbT
VKKQLQDVYIKQENIAILQDVDHQVNAGDYYKALAKLHPLIAYEAKLLNVEPHEWRRSGGAPRLGILADAANRVAPA